MMNCLVDKKIIVKHVFKPTSRYLDKKHVLYSGMMDGAFKTYKLPKTSSGEYKQVLTKDEEAFLEEYMNLEKGALSIHRTVHNYWDNIRVRLGKDDTFFNMANPDHFIKIKVLLANEDFICPSLKQLEEAPLPTYEYVIVDEGEKDKADKAKLTTTMEAYKLLGKIEEDTYKLRIILEMLEEKQVSEAITTDALLNKINDYITTKPKAFINAVQDPYLNSKILLRKCIDIKVVQNREGLLYLADGGTPLCISGHPTISVASEFINLPSQAELKLKLEAYVNQSTKYGKSPIQAKEDPLPELVDDAPKTTKKVNK